MLYYYGMRLRGYSPGCQPNGVLRRFDDHMNQYHDIIAYDRKLTEQEMKDYELEYLGSYRCLKALKSKEDIRTVEAVEPGEDTVCEWCGEETEELYKVLKEINQ